jgi:hypothetical protein
VRFGDAVETVECYGGAGVEEGDAVALDGEDGGVEIALGGGEGGGEGEGPGYVCYVVAV